MRRLRLLRDERRSREVGHEVGSFARSLGAASSLTEALIGDKMIYESNTRQTRAFIFAYESGRANPTRLVRENQLAASRWEFVSPMARIYEWEMQSCTHVAQVKFISDKALAHLVCQIQSRDVKNYIIKKRRWDLFY